MLTTRRILAGIICGSGVVFAQCSNLAPIPTSNIGLNTVQHNACNWDVQYNQIPTQIDLLLSGFAGVPAISFLPVTLSHNPATGSTLYLNPGDGLLHVRTAGAADNILGGLADPGSNGLVFRTGLNASRPAVIGDIPTLYPYANLAGVPSVLPPSGTAAGDLSGTYPNPTIATGKPLLNNLGNPGAAKTFAMGSNFLTFTFGATTSSSNMFVLQDTTSNSGTGYVATIGTASGSSANPLQVLCGGVQCGSVDGANMRLTFGDLIVPSFVTLGKAGFGNYGTIWLNQATPDATNFALAGSVGDLYVNAPTGAIHLGIGNAGDTLTVDTNGIFTASGHFTVDRATGATKALSLQLTGGTLPTCDVTMRSMQWYVPGTTGVADSLQVCKKNAADVYGWVALF